MSKGLLAMTCSEYIERFFSLHADDELIGRDRRVADDHIRQCLLCRARLADERRLKQLIRAQFGMNRIPADLRLRISAALGRMIDLQSKASSSWLEAPTRSNRQRLNRRQVNIRLWPKIAVGLVAAASLVLIFLRLQSNRTKFAPSASVPANPVFDYAISKYDAFSQEFIANAPSEPSERGYDYAWVIDRQSYRGHADESSDLAEAYRVAAVPEDIYDFEAVGYSLAGGRIDMQNDGWPAAFTLYRSQKGELVSICIHAPNFYAPIGARYWIGTHTFYEYRGHSLCLAFQYNHYVSILIANESVQNLLKDVTAGDAQPRADSADTNS